MFDKYIDEFIPSKEMREYLKVPHESVDTIAEIIYYASAPIEKCHDLAGNYHQPKEMLFIYGKNGCGKTTLLNALGNYAKQLSRQNLLYVTAENFVNEVIMAIRGNKMLELREKYRSLSWFIVDDIQFLCGKESSMEEFTHTLNDLLAMGAQVVISSDRPLEQLDLPEALKSKFSFATQMEMKGFSDTNMLVEQIKNDWDEIKESIKESGNLASIPFDNCIAPLEIGGLKDGILEVTFPEVGATNYILEHLTNRYKKMLEDAIQECCKQSVQVKFVLAGINGPT